MRPFRFLATVPEDCDAAALVETARRAEASGFHALVIPDHLVEGQLAPIPVLATVAAVTERLRIGTFVFNVHLRHPAVLAQDLATLDLLSGGRLDVGIGAGWNKPEYDAIGIPFPPVGVRVSQLTEAVAVLKGCFADGPFSFHGEHHTITEYDASPKPTQRPHPPFFIGGGGRRLLTLAGREAQTVGLAPRLLPGDQSEPAADPRSLTAEATEEKIGWIREAAGDRFAEIELNTYATDGPPVITNDAEGEAARYADRIRKRSGVELTVEEVLESPHVFIGSIQGLIDKFVEMRDRFGITSILLDDAGPLTPVVEALAGR